MNFAKAGARQRRHPVTELPAVQQRAESLPGAHVPLRRRAADGHHQPLRRSSTTASIAQTPAQRAEFIRSLPANLLVRDDKGKVSRRCEPARRCRSRAFKDGKINRDDWNGYRVPGAEPEPRLPAASAQRHLGVPAVPAQRLGAEPVRAVVAARGAVEGLLHRQPRIRPRPHRIHRSDRFRGGFRYDTSVEGNSNDGHLFQEGGPGNGIIGPLLTPDDRLAIIEFLKTLCPPGTRTD